jgi:hypothetical protein
MYLLKHLPFLSFWLLTAFCYQAGAEAKTYGYKSYREWKTQQVQDVQTKILTIRTQIDTRKTARGIDPNLAQGRKGIEAGEPGMDRLEKQLRQEQFDLDVAKDLSVTDYFVGYLTKVQDKKTAIHDVAAKLSPEEVAELMTAYANSVFGAHTSDLPVSASNFAKEGVK